MIKLASVKKKLSSESLLALTAEELEFYFLRRLDSLLRSKRVLVRRELEYLLGETGPGSRRIDPELLRYLTNEQVFTDSLIGRLPEIEARIAGKKTKLQNHILSDLQSQKNASFISALLGQYFKSLEIRSVIPLIFAGSFRQIPVHILVNNGGWIMPDRILFDFVSQARQSRCLAVVIAKKVHGILFPLFKSLGIIGANTYQTYVSGKTCREREKLEQEFNDSKKSDSLPWRVTYNERLEDLQELARHVSDLYHEGNMLKRFLEETLPRMAVETYSRGLDQQISLDGSFREIVMRLKDERLKVHLREWIEKRTALLTELEKQKNQKD